MKIQVPSNVVVTFSCATLPHETPIGIFEAAVNQAEFGGRKYQQIGDRWMDMATGDIVEIEFSPADKD